MPTKFLHERFGECDFVRVEGVDWIVRACSTGQLYRVPPSRRTDFKPISATLTVDQQLDHRESATPAKAEPTNTRSIAGVFKRLLWGIRPKPTRPNSDETVDRTDPSPNGHPRPTLTSSSEFSTDQSSPGVFANSHANTSTEREGSGVSSGRLNVFVNGYSTRSISQTNDKRRLRKIFESLRTGLSPTQTELRKFAVGIEVIEKKAQHLLDDVTGEGGRSVVLRGGYGQGKTFCLQLLRQMALEDGFAVMSAEIDAYENQLDKPHRVYRSLMHNLTFPDGRDPGALGIVTRTHQELSRRLGAAGNGELYASAAMRILISELECKPLAWMLSDPNLSHKPELLGLLSGENGVPTSSARRCHVIPGAPNDWPAFSAGTQGDFASYLLSGLGRLTRFLGFRGLIVVLDEMEKWQDLNWQAQSRAGNLLGGLIWGSSAEEGSRWCRTDRLDSRWLGDCDHADILEHSRRCGGYPFTTAKRCSVGLAIAMTPRGDEGPEATWSQYGLLEIVDLPTFSPKHLQAYMQRIFPDYLSAYDLTGELTSKMLNQAIAAWHQKGDGSTRTAIQATLSVLDEWRDAHSLM